MPAVAPWGLTDDAGAGFRLIPADEPAHVDALAQVRRLSIPGLAVVLLEPEMRSHVRQLPGQCFVRKCEGEPRVLIHRAS